jgi:hypothetical protein
VQSSRCAREFLTDSRFSWPFRHSGFAEDSCVLEGRDAVDVRLDPDDLEALDALALERGHGTRSAVVRELIRQAGRPATRCLTIARSTVTTFSVISNVVFATAASPRCGSGWPSTIATLISRSHRGTRSRTSMPSTGSSHVAPNGKETAPSASNRCREPFHEGRDKRHHAARAADLHPPPPKE